MMKQIPYGITDFSRIQKENYYYVDKTELIEQVLEDGSQVILFTRPRRFGKTLGMSMLANFFDIRKDSHELFNGLAISRNSGSISCTRDLADPLSVCSVRR